MFIGTLGTHLKPEWTDLKVETSDLFMELEPRALFVYVGELIFIFCLCELYTYLCMCVCARERTDCSLTPCQTREKGVRTEEGGLLGHTWPDLSQEL